MRAWAARYLVWGESLLALPTDELLVKRMAARVVDKHGGGFAPGEISIAPTHQRHQGRRQRHTHLGKPILVARWAFAVELAGKHAVLNQSLQALSENWFGDVEVLLEVVEPTRATERLAQNEHRPAITENAEARLDRALTCARRHCDRCCS